MRNTIIFCGMLFLLAACGGFGGSKTSPTDTRDHKDKKLEKYGTIFDDGGLFAGANVVIGGQRVGPGETGGVAVNAYLWRATLQSLSFMPLQQVDPFGGVILTEWHSPPDKPDERIKLNVFIIGKALRSDALQVTLFRETLNSSNNWQTSPTNEDTARRIENSILEKARQLRLKNLSNVEG